MFNFLAQNFQILIFLVIFFAPVLGRIVSKLNEQAKIKKLREQQERARLEALRTGRPVPNQARQPAQPTAQAARPPSSTPRPSPGCWITRSSSPCREMPAPP